MLYKPIGKIYRKLCFKEKQIVYFKNEQLAYVYLRIYAHHPLPFSDSFVTEIVIECKQIAEGISLSIKS